MFEYMTTTFEYEAEFAEALGHLDADGWEVLQCGRNDFVSGGSTYSRWTSRWWAILRRPKNLGEEI